MKITKYLIGGLAALALVGCKDKMRELNTNPETVGEADPRSMFLGANTNFDFGRSNGGSSAEYNAGLMFQYWSGFTYCDPQAGEYTAPSLAGTNWKSYYELFYGQRLASLQVYLRDNLQNAPEYRDLNAIAGILKLYQTFRLFENYGAAIYTEAFKAISEGVTISKYDLLTTDMYHALDNELKEYIAVLNAEKDPSTEPLGEYDYIYGWKAASTGKPTKQGNYAEQRTNWKKFGNAIRMDWAWRFKGIDETYCKNVMAEILADENNLMTKADEGAYFHHQFDITTNSDDISAISISYYLADNFIAQLKRTADPRLPLLARVNDLCELRDPASDPEYENVYHWISNFFPDSLQSKWVQNPETKVWEQKSWDGLLDINSDNPFQGMTADPGFNRLRKSNLPGMLWSSANITFSFYQDGYQPNNDEANDALPEWKVTGQDGETITIDGHSINKTLNIASHAQGRYYVQSGGRTTGFNTGGNGNDGPADYSGIYMRRPIFTYAEQCFMLAYLTEDGISTGKSASEWYEIAVREAMNELQQDAVRYKIQIATNEEYSLVPGINETKPYTLDQAKIDAFVAANGLDGAADKKEQIVSQAWVYFYNHPVKMWNWWRMTGYPKIVSVIAPDQRPDYAYLTEPHNGGETSVDVSKPLAFPRRATLGTPNTLNSDNYQAIRDELMRQSYPDFGSEFGATTGRVIWDVNGL